MENKSNMPSRENQKRDTAEMIFLIENALSLDGCGHCKNITTEYSSVWGRYISGCSLDLMDTREYCHCEGFSISDKTKSQLERLKKELED